MEVIGVYSVEPVVVFERASGVICYVRPLFARERRWLAPGEGQQMPPEVPDQLLATAAIDWHWASARNHPAAGEASAAFDLPAVRPLTQLTTSSRGVFLLDWQERDVGGEGRGIAVFGVDREFDPRPLSGEELARLVRRFAKLENGPIRIVIIQPGDTNEEYVFVPGHPVEPVADLLQRLGFTGASRTRRRRYRRLGVMQLELLDWGAFAPPS